MKKMVVLSLIAYQLLSYTVYASSFEEKRQRTISLGITSTLTSLCCAAVARQSRSLAHDIVHEKIPATSIAPYENVTQPSLLQHILQALDLPWEKRTIQNPLGKQRIDELAFDEHGNLLVTSRISTASSGKRIDSTLQKKYDIAIGHQLSTTTKPAQHDPYSPPSCQDAEYHGSFGVLKTENSREHSDRTWQSTIKIFGHINQLLATWTMPQTTGTTPTDSTSTTLDFYEHKNKANALELSLFIGGYDGRVWQWKHPFNDDPRLLATSKGKQPSHGEPVKRVLLCPDQQHIISASASSLRRTSLNTTARSIVKLMKHNKIYHIAFNGDTIITGGWHNTTTLLDFNLNEIQTVQQPHFTSTFAINPEGTTIACGTENGAVTVLDAPETAISSLKDIIAELITYERIKKRGQSTPLSVEQKRKRDRQEDNPFAKSTQRQRTLHPIELPDFSSDDETSDRLFDDE